jgi:hypothetical protein
MPLVTEEKVRLAKLTAKGNSVHLPIPGVNLRVLATGLSPYVYQLG